MLKIKDIAVLLEEWAPLELAEKYDNVGLIIGNPEAEVNTVIVCLDYTEKVLELAIEKRAELIIMHHPIWFQARKKLTAQDWIGRLLLRTIRANINLYAIHTNLDKAVPGVNHKIAEKLNLQNLHIIQRELPSSEFGIGIYGELSRDYTVKEFLSYISEVFKVSVLRYAKTKKQTIRKIGICGGAGSFLLPQVRRLALDAYITSDITYHKFFDNEQRFLLVDVGHYETEQFTIELIVDFLQKRLKNLLILPISFPTNPIYYYAHINKIYR